MRRSRSQSANSTTNEGSTNDAGYGDPAGGPVSDSGAAQPQRQPSRLSQAWVTLSIFAVLVVLLLIFILQNLQDTDISYLGAHGRLPLGVLMLLGAVAGVALAVMVGTLRIVQLKVRARREAKRLRSAGSPQSDSSP